MQVNILGININYTHVGHGKNLVLLHGWGLNLNYFNNLINDLKDNYSIYAIDLPGFGKSELRESFNTTDYSEIVLEFIKHFKIDSPTLLGHSFGGKVIIDLVTNRKYNPNKIILIDSAGINKKKSIYKKYKVYKFKLLKNLIKKFYNEKRANYLLDDLRRKYGSRDYNNSNVVLRNTLVKVVNDNYIDKLSLIKCPTILLWGEYDTETPISDGMIMNKYIKDSTLITIKNANHFPLSTNYMECLLIIDSFLRS